ncbi:glutamate-cysteine ligase family protein [Streptomyces abikoensis]|uniref:carboxylate-amine ligase n=1 Tax=Streptomyces abikoensis TaxID=97398 RepID=UPI0036BCC4DA
MRTSATTPRYHAGLLQYRSLLDEFVLCALHAHVHLPERETAVLVSNHLRPWLPLLVAMSANSPYHRGRDTGYAGWRAVIRGCFPCLGPPPYATSLDEYEHLAAARTATEAMPEPGMPFWDVRPNPHPPTLEVRTMDVLPDTDDTVAKTLIIRALVTTSASSVAEVPRGRGLPAVRTGVAWKVVEYRCPLLGQRTIEAHTISTVRVAPGNLPNPYGLTGPWAVSSLPHESGADTPQTASRSA